MFGPFDTESLHFQTRCLIRRIQKLTGESERDAVHQALVDRFHRLTDLVQASHYDKVTVELAPDLTEAFRNSGAVNDALRELLRRRGRR